MCTACGLTEIFITHLEHPFILIRSPRDLEHFSKKDEIKKMDNDIHIIIDGKEKIIKKETIADDVLKLWNETVLKTNWKLLPLNIKHLHNNVETITLKVGYRHAVLCRVVNISQIEKDLLQFVDYALKSS